MVITAHSRPWAGDVSLALEFANSWGSAGHSPIDGIATPEDLSYWLEEHGLATGPDSFPSSPPDRRLLVTEAIRLRSEIDRLFRAVSSGGPVASMTLVALNRYLAADALSTRLTQTGASLSIDQFWIGTSPFALLTPIAQAAAEVVATAAPDRLRQCAAATCENWFLDTSKGGRRRWCSMSRCGNRAKAARFREKNTPTL